MNYHDAMARTYRDIATEDMRMRQHINLAPTAATLEVLGRDGDQLFCRTCLQPALRSLSRFCGVLSGCGLAMLANA